MRRIILSIILGIVFPVVCMMAIGAMSDYLPKPLTELNFSGKLLPGILYVPFTIPLFCVAILRAYEILPPYSETIWHFLALFILFDWILYGTLSYLVLGRLKRFKKRIVSASENPPPPPAF